MLHWISANLSTILITLVLIAIVVLIIRSLIRQKKQGKDSVHSTRLLPCKIFGKLQVGYNMLEIVLMPFNGQKRWKD